MKVQILLSTYNGERYLKEQIESLINQIGVDISILIRDDGSSDSTLQILNEYSNRKNISVIYGRNIGVVNSFFELINKSSCNVDYYALADQDDFWLPNKVLEATKTINEKKIDSHTPLLYASKQTIVNNQMEKIGFSKGYEKKLSSYNAVVENVVTGCTAVFNKKTKELLCTKQTKDIIMHDWWLYLLVSSFGEVIFDNNSYIYYRQHQNNVVGYNNKGFSRIKKFYKRIKNGDFNKINKQTALFYNIYMNELDDDFKSDLKKFIDSENNIINRIKIVMDSKFYRHNFYDNIILKLLILMNLI